MQNFFDRLKGLLQGVFVVAVAGIMIVFSLGRCSSEAKWALGLVGLYDDGKDEDVVIRPFDPENPNDTMFATGLLAASAAAGLDLDTLTMAILESEDVNAFTFGERHFVFFDGLASAPREVVAVVIAHEVAHAKLGHSSSLGEKAGWIDSVTRIAGTFAHASPEAVEEVSGWTSAFVVPRYSQEFELEADAEAVEILREIGFGEGSESMVQFALTWLRDNSGDSDLGGGYFSSHPSIQERIDAIGRP